MKDDEMKFTFLRKTDPGSIWKLHSNTSNWYFSKLLDYIWSSKSRLGGAPASATQSLGGSAWPPASFFSSNSTTSCFISTGLLLIDFDSAQHWCSSIKSYYYNDDVFNFDYGQAKAAVGNYQVQPILKKDFCRREKNQEAEEIFLNITSEKLKSDYAYLSWLARCFIMNGKVGPNGKNVDLKHFLFEGPIGLGALPEDGNVG